MRQPGHEAHVSRVGGDRGASKSYKFIRLGYYLVFAVIFNLTFGAIGLRITFEMSVETDHLALKQRGSAAIARAPRRAEQPGPPARDGGGGERR